MDYSAGFCVVLLGLFCDPRWRTIAPPPLRRYPSVLDMGKMEAVEYEGEAGFFHQRLILRTASTAAMLNTTGRMCDSPNGLFWILTPDGDVYPEPLRVPPATGTISLYERNEPIPTTMMPAGRHLEQVYEFRSELTGAPCSPEVIVRAVLGAQETEDTCREGERPGLPEASPPPATPDTPPGRKVDEGDSLDPGDTVTDPLLDARVSSVQRNSAGDRHREFATLSELVQSPWAGWPVSGPRTFLWCWTFMSEHALHPLAHHS